MNPVTISFWHGWGADPGVWTDLTASLRQILPPGHVLHTPPLPGYADTPLPESHAARDMVDALMETLPPPAIVCGWSLGAVLALLAASVYSNRIDKLILIAGTPAFIKRTDWQHGTGFQAVDKLSSNIRVDPVSALRRFVAFANQNDAQAQQIVQQFHAPAVSLQTLEVGLNLLKHTDLRGVAPHIRQKTLLIHGAHDPLMPLGAAQWLQKNIKKAELTVFPDSAHAPFLSDTAHCARVIADFMNA
ncbi:MAG: alpha/beta fold hydrolase [Burkholderiaceae bacterium]|nr:alpha/beta fold hydrolase [Burkholderiaceae bacterium]